MENQTALPLGEENMTSVRLNLTSLLTAEPLILDYRQVGWPPGAVLLTLSLLTIPWCFLIARFYHLAVLRPSWTPVTLPYENVFYILFSVSLSDLILALTCGAAALQLLVGTWYLTLPFCKLWRLLEAMSASVRILSLLVIQLRLIRGKSWQRTAKISLVSLVWLLALGGGYSVTHAVGLRASGVCDLSYPESAPAASVWRYLLPEGLGLLLLPLAGATFCWLRGRVGYGGLPQEGETPGSEGQQCQVATVASPDQTAPASPAQPPPVAPEGVDLPRPPGPTSLSSLKRARYRLTRFETYTPSTFTLRHFWGSTSLDGSDPSYETAGVGGSSADPLDDLRSGHCSKHRCITLHEVTAVKERAGRFILVLCVVQTLFSLVSLAVHVLLDLELTDLEDRPDLNVLAKVLDLSRYLQPLVNSLVFTVMFPKFYRLAVG